METDLFSTVLCDTLTFGVTHYVKLLCVLSPRCCLSLWSLLLLDTCETWRRRNVLNYSFISWMFLMLHGCWDCQHHLCWPAFPCYNTGAGYWSLMKRDLQACVQLWHQDIRPFLVWWPRHPMVWLRCFFVSLCLEIGIDSVWTKRDSSELLLRLFKGKSIGFCCERITGVPVRKKTWRKLPHFGWRGDLSA